MEFKDYNVYGTFKVTTEGDCEGKSIRDLGVHTGFVDEIAFALADKCYYTLHFSLAEPKSLDLTPKKDTVKISLDINSGIWDLKGPELKRYFQKFFANRDLEVVSTHGYGSCTISTHKETMEEKRAKILSKLSDEEKSILGLM